MKKILFAVAIIIGFLMVGGALDSFQREFQSGTSIFQKKLETK